MASSPDTSASLLEQAKNASADAWPRLVSIYAPVLDAWLATVGVQAADRDDLRQRVLEVLVRQIGGFEPTAQPGAFRAWLRRITTNLLHEHWRRRPADGDSRLAELADPRGSLSLLWEEQHDRHVLHRLMEMVRPEFTESTWQAFRQVALEGVAPSDAAAQLGLSVNAVLIAKSRVLARLRQEARGLVD